MKNCLFTVFDSAAEVYCAPFVATSKGAALRQFIDFLGKDGHPFNQHPADYTLFYIGSFDDSSCEFETSGVLEKLGNGQELAAKK